jgi:glycerophosphoryl diester phosphodiesterase
VGTRTISEFKQAGIELSVFNADEQVDMQYYAAQASNMKAICTNYPKRLLSLMGKL